LSGADREEVGGPTLNLANLDPLARKVALDEHLRAEISVVLGLGSEEQVQPRSRLMDLGMDSLMAVELRARLQRSLGVALQTTLLFDHPTVEALVEYLSTQFAGENDESTAGAQSKEASDDELLAEPGSGRRAVPAAAATTISRSGEETQGPPPSPDDDRSLVQEVEALSEEELLQRLRS
ncbi:MAG: acyl carrier protein, partial [Pseudomonadota bacterium]